MTKEQITKACDLYLEVLPDPVCGRDIHPMALSQKMAHVAWMCTELKSPEFSDDMEKNMRWLGFIQGILWSKGYFTIEELSDHNR